MGLMISDGLEVDLVMDKFLVYKSILSEHLRDRKSKLLKLFWHPADLVISSPFTQRCGRLDAMNLQQVVVLD